MVIKSFIKFISNTPVMLMLRIVKLTNETSRTGFVLTAINEGIYEIMQSGPVTFQEIQIFLQSDFNPEGLRAWLDLGVSLGELKKNSRGYSICGKLSKELSKPSNDTWRAFLQVRTEAFYNFIINTPSMIKKNRQFESSEAHGELVARSSRTLKPVLYDVVETLIPRKHAFRLLEVGCGSGIYIRRACERNPMLSAVGLEIQKNVADLARKNIESWNIDDRVSIENADIRNYDCDPTFDLVTFYNLIYYFPVEERSGLLKNLGNALKPGGKLVLTSMCQANDPSLSLMNLWTSMTDGYGALPSPGQIHSQLEAAGYCNIESKMLIPSFIFFKAEMKFGSASHTIDRTE